MFGKKDVRTNDTSRREIVTHPAVIKITIECLKTGLAFCVNSLREDIEKISNECGLQWAKKDIDESVEMLSDVCLFFLPPFATQTLNDETISQKYFSIFMDSMRDRIEVFKYFTEISEKYKTPPIGLFPFLLALKYRPAFEQIMKSVMTAEISARAISFTNDFAAAFCRNNPVVEGFLGDSIARTTIQK